MSTWCRPARKRTGAARRLHPAFVMAGELVETGRLWARQNAAIKPEWVDLLSRQVGGIVTLHADPTRAISGGDVQN